MLSDYKSTHITFPVSPLHSQFLSLHWTSANHSYGYNLDLFIIQTHFTSIISLTDYQPYPFFPGCFLSYLNCIFHSPYPRRSYYFFTFSKSLTSSPNLLSSLKPMANHYTHSLVICKYSHPSESSIHRGLVPETPLPPRNTKIW